MDLQNHNFRRVLVIQPQITNGKATKHDGFQVEGVGIEHGSVLLGP